MKTNFYSSKNKLVIVFALAFLIAFAAVKVASAQSQKEPKRHQLLNNLRLLVWSEPAAANVLVKLRIHSGAAFDPREKAGAMRLLADSLFPDETVNNYFTEDLGGKLSVESNYDFIEITASGKSENLLDILETVRNGVSSAALTTENFKKVRDARLKIVQGQTTTAEDAADLLIRKRLFGDYFPYGRPSGGTAETIQKIERADLLQLRERLLTADNATLAISGNVDKNYAHRAVRQLFGSWQKSDKPVPATFRQPDAVEKTVFYQKQPSVRTAQIRFAVRAAARGSANDFAHKIAAQVLNERWRKELPQEMRDTAFVRYEPHALPGMLIFGASIAGGFAEPVLPQTQTALNKILSEPVAVAEFENAKSAVAAKIENDLKSHEAAIESWLDADTFKVNQSTRSISTATLKSVQDLFADWQKQTFAAVAVTQGEGNAQRVIEN